MKDEDFNKMLDDCYKLSSEQLKTITNHCYSLRIQMNQIKSEKE